MTQVITLQQIEAQHSKVAEMIATYKAQAAQQVVIAQTTITLRDGERYAGIAFEKGAPSHHLILLPQKPSDRLNWQAAQAWATEVGGELPTRFESALLYASLRDEFDTNSWHWTATQYSGVYAWGQDFGGGNQIYTGEGYELFARAVRRLPI